jgi:anti-anti-sigma factor
MVVGGFMSTRENCFELRAGGRRDPLMSLTLTRFGAVTVIDVSGEVDMSNAHLLTEIAEHVVRDQPVRLVLDLMKVTFFSADGLRALLRIQRAVTVRTGQLTLRDPSPITLRVLTIAGMDCTFEIQSG